MKSVARVKKLFALPTARITIPFALALVAAGWIATLVTLPRVAKTAGTIPLHYNIYFGVDAIGSWWQLLIVPAFATLVFLVNMAIALWQREQDRLIPGLLLVSTVVTALLLDLALVFVLLLNT